ncbi:MAG TPA: MerC domain-containing protein [Gemmatimonadaceae bacterium]|jgi:hypothetical protein|nr:MerC domain-containing protein [Gemmatimonadaceae bacterium]
MTASFTPARIHSSLEGDAPDRVAVWTSVACAIHCALMPLVLPLLPYAIGGVVGRGTEHAFRGLALVLGILSLGHSYRVVHRRWMPLGLFVCGMALLFSATLQTSAHSARELLLVLIGASSIIAAHVVNLRLRANVRAGLACGCACHDD